MEKDKKKKSEEIVRAIKLLESVLRSSREENRRSRVKRSINRLRSKLKEMYPDIGSLTDEQIERGKLHSKTDPYFWEMAPSILKEMWEKEEPDNNWTSRISEEAKKMLQDNQYQGTSLLEIDCRQSL